MRYLRTFALLLLTIFLIDTVSASTVLHLPSADSMQHEHAVHTQHDHQAMQHANQHAGHDTSSANCSSCHDCLSCFSMLLSLPTFNTIAKPYSPQDDAREVIYFSPALALLQRPPINS
ncbi:hypothetical protein LG201_01625 [Methylobacillus gramineus]|uniref:hypothetical protein n=1 Tax=Methylobacillus gramineus TaxID=755169 RepID=UPI001CFFC352|nr:hypothetical protein [Methylobacillus gramineus]MCB5183901.1 hypothetical protein [Methylobacillus gramineus]